MGRKCPYKDMHNKTKTLGKPSQVYFFAASMISHLLFGLAVQGQSAPLISELYSEVSFSGLRISPQAGRIEVLTPSINPELHISAQTRVEIFPGAHLDAYDGFPDQYGFFDYRFIIRRPEGDSNEAITTKISFEATGRVDPIHELNIRGLSAWADSKIIVGLLGAGSKYSYDFGVTSPREAYFYTGDGRKVEKLHFELNTLAELVMTEGSIPLGYEIPYSFHVSAWATSGQLYNSRDLPDSVGVGSLAASLIGLFSTSIILRRFQKA